MSRSFEMHVRDRSFVGLSERDSGFIPSRTSTLSHTLYCFLVGRFCVLIRLLIIDTVRSDPDFHRQATPPVCLEAEGLTRSRYLYDEQYLIVLGKGHGSETEAIVFGRLHSVDYRSKVVCLDAKHGSHDELPGFRTMGTLFAL